MNSGLQALFESASWPILFIAAEGAILQPNPAAARLFGPALTETPDSLEKIWSADSRTSFSEFFSACAKSSVSGLPIRLKVESGSHQSFGAFGFPSTDDSTGGFYVQLIPENIPTDTKLITSESIGHKQKLDCALKLARTVSLDFNNVLTSILGHTSLLLGRAETDHPWKKSLLEIEKSATRAAQISNDLALFSLQEKDVKKTPSGNLNTLLQRAVSAFQDRTLPVPVKWSTQLERQLYAARFEEANIYQVFSKIIDNAIESFQTDGRITLQTRNLELKEPTQDRNVRLLPGVYVCVEISDNGCGIDAESLPRVFEPFFTTKRDGKHRGLGLALVYGMVSNHKGGVAISSQAGVGTSVRVYLPAEQTLVNGGEIHSREMSGTESILVVDDEDLLLTMTQTVLSDFGYKVATASSGPKALDYLKANPNTVDLVITDMVMPAMTGRELIDQMEKISPGLQVLRTSGYVSAQSRQNEISYLQKPFSTQDLLARVKLMLTPEEPETN
jgi:two-component system cell cycle sensor histidine kinase/response regulator CckA